jgi:hypothetical protein
LWLIMDASEMRDKNSKKSSRGKSVQSRSPFPEKGQKEKPNVAPPVAKVVVYQARSQRDLYQEKQESRKHSNQTLVCEMGFPFFFGGEWWGVLCCSRTLEGSAEVCLFNGRYKNLCFPPGHTGLIVPDSEKLQKRQCLSREKDQNSRLRPQNPFDCVVDADDETAKGKRSRKQRGSVGGREARLVSMGDPLVFSDPLSAPLSPPSGSIRKGSANLCEK